MDGPARSSMDLAGETVPVTGALGGMLRERTVRLGPFHDQSVQSGRNREALNEMWVRLPGEMRRIDVFDRNGYEWIPRWCRSVGAESGPWN